MLSIIYSIISVLLALACGLWGGVNAVHIDWSIFGVAFMCLTPALVLLDLAVMLVTAWTFSLAASQDTRARERALLRQASTLGLHLVTAVLGVALLAIPAGSVIIRGGIVLFEVRVLFLALAVLSVLKALPMPYRLFSSLSAALAARRGEDR